jgi:hypothetical protein
MLSLGDSSWSLISSHISRCWFSLLEKDSLCDIPTRVDVGCENHREPVATCVGS